MLTPSSPRPAASRPQLRQTLKHWQQDSDFAGIRGDAALAKLPEAEREPWRKLWAAVAATRAKARDQGAPAAKPDQKP